MSERPLTPSATYEPAPGDRVEIIDGKLKGTFGKVVALDADDFRARVVIDDGRSGWFSDRELRLEEEGTDG